MSARTILVALATCLLGAGAARAETVLLGNEAAGIFEISTESRLDVAGLSGELIFRVGKPGELRFLATAPEGGKAAEEIPVSLLRDGSVLELRPGPGNAERAVRLEAALPPGMWLKLAVRGGEASISGLKDGVDVVAHDAALDVSVVEGGASVEVHGGKVELRGMADDVALRGDGFTARIDAVAGAATIGARGGTVEASGVAGTLDVDLDGTDFRLRDSVGPLRLSASGGRVEVAGLRNGARMHLGGTPLVIAESDGRYDVDTDADVEFRDMSASLHFDSYGGSLRGAGNDGVLEIKTSNSEVALERISGETRIAGDGLRVEAATMGGAVVVYAAGSTLAIDGAAGPVEIENDYGDVTVAGAAKGVSIKSRDGTVVVSGLNGAARIDADGPEVRVGWASVAGSDDSEIRNASGDVWVSIGGNGGCRIEASAKYGRIESSLEGVAVSGDGNHASGRIRRANAPTIRIESEGNVVLASGAAAAQDEEN